MLPIITAAVTPAVALLIFFYLKDGFEQEPVKMVLRTFTFGAILVFPVMFFQFALQYETGISNVFLAGGIQQALTEEFLKWFIVLIAVFPHTHFNQRYDGIVYAVSVALGFASVENVLYIVANGLDTAFFRAVFPVTGHALFGVVMGYYFGKAKFNYSNRYRYLIAALFLPIILHSSYNLILTYINHWIYLLVPFMTLLWVLALRKVKRANRAQALYFTEKEAG